MEDPRVCACCSGLLGNRPQVWAQAGRRFSRAAADTVIDKAGVGHFLRLINVAQIDNDRLGQHFPSHGRDRARGTQFHSVKSTSASAPVIVS